MNEAMTKTKLLAEMRASRAEWDALMAEVGEARMTEAGATGYWSVKDVMAHLMCYARWFLNALEADLRGEAPPSDGTEAMDFEEKNQVYYRQTRDLSLAEVMAESQRVHERLIELVAGQPEEWLLQPQQFIGVPVKIVPWHPLRSEVYDHCRVHIKGIREWLEKTP